MIHIEQEPDRVPSRPIRVSVIVIAIAIAGSIGAVVLLAGPDLGEVVRPRVAPPERIDTQVFPLETPAEHARFDADVRLHAYGWVDRAHGIVHVPLDVATDLYLQEHGR